MGTGTKTAAGSGTLAKWNERRKVLEGQQDAITNELAQIDAFGRMDLGSGLVARIQPDGSLLINAGQAIPAECVLALRDHLYEVLGLPDCLADVADVTTMNQREAQGLAADLARRAIGNTGRHDNISIDVRTAIFDALDHVGVIRSETQKPGKPESGPDAARVEARNAGRGESGSAQDQVEDVERFDESTGPMQVGHAINALA